MKRVVLSVTNDLVSDQRVQRSISVLQKEGFEVLFVGRRHSDSHVFNPDYTNHRFKLWFKSGFLFYAQYNLWLFFFLLFQKPFDLYWSNDLDTLLPNFLISKLYRKPLIYDSHEYFTGAPEIESRPAIKWFWTGLEKFLFPKLKHILTVNESIAQLYLNEYQLKPKVLRNVGNTYLPNRFKSRAQLNLPEEAYLVINQGSGINVDRGMEEFVLALSFLDKDIHLVIVGKGDVIPALKLKVDAQGMNARVHFIDPVPYQELLHYTAAADLGISLDKDTNLNYRFSLPNKVFDYIKCEIPILCSEVVEVKRLVTEYKIGKAVAVEPEILAAAVQDMRTLGRSPFLKGLQKAKSENNWEQEQGVISDLLHSIYPK